MIQSCYLEKCLIKIPAVTMIWTLRNLPYQSHFIYGTTFFNQQNLYVLKLKKFNC